MIRNARLFGLAGVAALLAAAALRPNAPARERIGYGPIARRPPPSPQHSASGVYWASALLALAALADSGIEHYRGSFHNRAMYVPLGVSAVTLAASLGDAVGARGVSGRGGNIVDNAALATGVIGTGFHLYNIVKRPGGFSWLNLFYAAPIGAPAALSLAALLRKAAEAVRRNVIGLHQLGRLLAGLVSAGMLGTSAEAGLLHFRGAYHNPAMVIPVTVPPLAASLLARAALAPSRENQPTRWLLRSIACIGVLGSAFHAYGIQRNMGGWRNLSQNLLNGPPLPAPPSFTALAVAGLIALNLIEDHNP